MPPISNTDPQPLRKACDQCRARKYKCTGEPTGCTRCVSDGAGGQCRYSGRGAMGRPPRVRPGEKVGVGLSSKEKRDGVQRVKKRRREGDDGEGGGGNEHLGSGFQGQPFLSGEEMDDSASGGMLEWGTVEDGYLNIHDQLQVSLPMVSTQINRLPLSISHTHQQFNSRNFQEAFVSPFEKVDVFPGAIGNSNNPNWPFNLGDEFGIDPFATLEMQLARGDLEGAGLFDRGSGTEAGDVDSEVVTSPHRFGFRSVHENGFSASTNSGFGLLGDPIPMLEPATTSTPAYTLPQEPNLPNQPHPQEGTRPSSTTSPFLFSTLPACICPSSFHECHKALQSATIVLQALLSSVNPPTYSTSALKTCYTTALSLGKITLETCRSLITCNTCSVIGMPNMLLVGTVLPVMVGVYERAIGVLLDERFYGGQIDRIVIAGIKATKWRRVAIDALRRDMAEVENIAEEMVRGTVVGFKNKVMDCGRGSVPWKSRGEAMQLRQMLRETEEKAREKKRADEREQDAERVELVEVETPPSQPAGIDMDQLNPIHSATPPSFSTPSSSSSPGTPPTITTDTTPSQLGSSPPTSHFPADRWKVIVEHLSENPTQELPPCIKTVLDMQDHVLLWTAGIELVYERGLRLTESGEDANEVNEELKVRRREVVEKLRGVKEGWNGVVVEWDGGGVVMTGRESGLW